LRGLGNAARTALPRLSEIHPISLKEKGVSRAILGHPAWGGGYAGKTNRGIARRDSQFAQEYR
jgi:hypothetical protein